MVAFPLLYCSVFSPLLSRYPVPSPGVFYHNNVPVMIPIVSLEQSLHASFIPNNNGIQTVSDIHGFHREGPQGANLFVFNLPSRFCENDLLRLFQEFGFILSAKVRLLV